MARSTYVYVVEHWVTSYGGGEFQLLGAFTVKHEMLTTIGQVILEQHICPDLLRIWRVHDDRIASQVDITNQFTWSTL